MNNVIYIGSSINHGEIMTNQLFTERPAELINRLKEKFPLIEQLFVNVADYPTALKELHTAGTVRAAAYRQVKEA